MDQVDKVRTTFEKLIFLGDSQGVPWLIFEFMHYGDLAGILLANSGVTSFQNDKLPILSKVR